MDKKIYIYFILFIIISTLISTFVKSNYFLNNSKIDPLNQFHDSCQSSEFFYQNANNLLSNTHCIFTENYGQLENNDVRFYAPGGGLWITEDGVWFELRENIEGKNQESKARTQEPQTHTPPHSYTPTLPHSQTPTQKYKRVILKQEFVGANQVKPIGRHRLSWNSNFFYGNDSSKWCTDVPNYNEIYYENLYDSIDLRYYTNDKGLKYDFIIHPGAEVNQIRIKYLGAEGLLIDEFGNLMIKTEIKNLIDGKLFIYQDYKGQQYHVEGIFIKYNDLEYGFKIQNNYCKFEDLIIDPLIYSTFIGGMENETSTAVAVDSRGNAYITGWTLSPDFPTIPDSFDTTGNFSNQRADVFVCKLKSNGSGLIYSTYIGGNFRDSGMDIAIDSMGNAYITGGTYSIDFPTTPSAYNKSFTGRCDCFVLKLNYNGSSLIYSTFIGGGEGDYGSGLVIDKIGNAYVTGYTDKCEGPPYIDFPTTSGAYDVTNNCHPFTAFIFKISANGSSLLYSTFLGGNTYDLGDDIAIDQRGNVYVTGYTASYDFPTTPGAYNRSFNLGEDVFVSKLNLSGLGSSDLIYSTFVGGNYQDWGKSIILDEIGNIIVVGDTCSNNFPTTDGAFNRTHAGGPVHFDCFILKLNQNMSELIFSTYIGGNNDDMGTGIAMDSIGDILITGITNSTNFPITFNAYDKTINKYEVFLSKLSHDGKYLNYSTFLGGSDDEKYEWGWEYMFWGCFGHIGMCVDNIGNIYLTGHTLSSDFPTTTGAHDRSINGKCDVFVSKFYFKPYINITSLSLLKNSTPINITYSRLCQYTFQVKIVDTANITDIKKVFLILDPLGTNIQLCWDSKTGQFYKHLDPNNYVFIESTSRAYNYFYWWTFEFNVIFNWSYPHENFNDVQVFATSSTFSPVWFNASTIYYVENDLVFDGNLSVKDEYNRTINDNGLVRGGEKLNWSGLKVVYENTTDVYPPINEYDITIWNENGYLGNDSPAWGENFIIQTTISSNTDIDGDIHIINLSGIPPECDKTNESFTIKIDGDNVIFSNPKPDNKTWQTDTETEVGITVTDIGGGFVDGKNITYSISNDNGTTWNDWILIKDKVDATNIEVWTSTTFEDGKNNLIKWQAIDTVGNGPVISSEYRVLVDTEEVRFSNPWPSETFESPTQNVEVGINISDNISGLNAQSIEYSILLDMGKLWSSWNPVPILTNGTNIVVRLDLFFPNGTNNYIKWRASDIAGNGPTESKVYQIKVNTWLQQFIPQVKLWAPPNGSIIPSTSVELSWFLINKNLVGVKYDLFLDTINPPITKREVNLTDTHFKIFDLIDGETYYWTVIPKLEDEIGWCDSGVWSFSINTSVPFPKVQLISPENNSIITSPKPTLIWSLEYEGTEKVTYNVYLDTNEVPIEYEKSENTYYLPNRILEDNTTYFWKVIPMAGNVAGPSSATWRFTVKKGYVPTFGLKLELEPMIVGVQPGGITYAKAKVTNLGEITDSVSLNIEIPPDKDVGAIVNEPITIDLEPGTIGIFNITVTATEDIKQNEVILTIVATSEKAKELGKTVEVRETLTVKIIRTEEPGEDKSTTEQNLWIFLLIALIIIIVVIILFIVLKRKKQAKEELPTSETVTIKPMESPELEKPQEQLSPTPTIAQPPTISTPESEEKVITPGTVAPELPITSMESHEVTPQQITKVEPKPQLPPAKPQISTQESKDETPTPTLVNSNETSEDSTRPNELNEDLPKSQD